MTPLNDLEETLPELLFSLFLTILIKIYIKLGDISADFESVAGSPKWRLVQFNNIWTGVVLHTLYAIVAGLLGFLWYIFRHSCIPHL